MKTDQTTNSDNLSSGIQSGSDVAATYCQRRFAGSRRMRRLNRMELEFCRRVAGMVQPEGLVLDAPCGSGRFFEILSAAGRITMLDLNAAMLGTVRDNHGRNGELYLLQGDVGNLPFADDSFDLCFCMRLFHHIGDDGLRRQMLGELARVSRRFVALSFYKTESWRYIGRMIRGKKPRGRSVSTGRFVSTAADAGLRLMQKTPRMSFIEQQQMLLFEKA